MLVILSPSAIESNNVMDEVAFALDERRTVIPVLHRDCRVPFRLRRLQYIDFRSEYGGGLQALVNALADEHQVGRLLPDQTESGSAPRVVAPTRLTEERIQHETAEAARKSQQERTERENDTPAPTGGQDGIERETAKAAEIQFEQQRIARQKVEPVLRHTRETRIEGETADAFGATRNCQLRLADPRRKSHNRLGDGLKRPTSRPWRSKRSKLKSWFSRFALIVGVVILIGIAKNL